MAELVGIYLQQEEKRKEFGLWLASLREESGFSSQRQLALASDVSPTTISRIEAGTQKAEPQTLAKLAPHLKVPVELLMARAGYLPENIELNIEYIEMSIRDAYKAIQHLRNQAVYGKHTDKYSAEEALANCETLQNSIVIMRAQQNELFKLKDEILKLQNKKSVDETAVKLSADEMELIEKYRRMQDNQKDTMHKVADTILPADNQQAAGLGK